jgi:hypothetical protein
MASIGPMTVIAMSRTEIDRMSVLHDLADGRICWIGSGSTWPQSSDDPAN